MVRKVVPVEQRRLQIILAPAALGLSIEATCERYGVSRTQFYEWRSRYRADGVTGLCDRSSRPKTSPRQTEASTEAAVCDMRAQHPRWGPRRIRTELKRLGADAPAKSTVGRILVRNGLITPRPRRRRVFARFVRPCPNDLWQIDGKEVWLGDGTEAWIVSILDDHARFLIACRASSKLDGSLAWEAFELGVSCHGMPREVLSDNGSCFSGRNRGLVVEFERKLWVLGIKTIASTPQHPQTLGKIERFHRTLNEHLEELPPMSSLWDLQRHLDAFRWHYNEARPNQAFADDSTPKEVYLATEPAVPDGAHRSRSVKRKVNNVGVVYYCGWIVNVTSEWIGMTVDVHEESGEVRIIFGDELVTSFSTEDPKGYLGTGLVRGGNRLPRRLQA